MNNDKNIMKIETWLMKKPTVSINHTNNYKSMFNIDDNKGMYYSDNDVDILLTKKGVSSNREHYVDNFMGENIAIVTEGKQANCNYIYKLLANMMSNETFMIPIVTKKEGFANMYTEVGMDLNKMDLINYLKDNSK